MTEKRFRVFKIDDMYGVSDDVTQYTVAWDKSKLIMENLCVLLNELQEENQRLLELSSGILEFAKDGGFSCLRRDGKYYIFSENVIPKNKAIISINSPDILFNGYIADNVMGLIEKLSENESFKHRGLFHE